MSIFLRQKNPYARDQSTMHGLIKQLLKVWSNKKVEDRYQNYFLIYLDTLSRENAEKAIAKEIKLTLQNNSYFFKIDKEMALRQSILFKIHKLLNQTSKDADPSLSDLKYFSRLLNQLRHSNLSVAEEVLSFNYQCLANGKHEIELIQGNNYIFQKLNADNQIIKSSFLQSYIAFSPSYDPFFLHHYEHIKKSENNKRQNDSISQIFNLTISKAYKFMRAQQQILQFLSGRIPNKLLYGKIKRFNYQLIEQSNNFNLEKDENQKFNRFKLQNNIYMHGRDEDSDNQQEYDALKRSKTEQSQKIGYHHYLSSSNKPTYKDKNYFNNYRLPKLSNINSRVYQSQNYTNLSNKSYNIRKLSEEDSINKYSFKIRRMSLKDNQYDNFSIFKKKAGYIKGLDKIKKEEERLLTVSQKVYNTPKYDKIEDKAEDQQQQPLQNRQKDSPTIQIRPITIQPQIESKQALNTALSNNFKLKAGNLKITNIATFLRELTVKQKYRMTFQVSNWEASIKNNQYYLHKFYINDQLEAISLCCPLPEGNILIKYWAPLITCTQSMSHLLFKRYLQHIERNTICKIIYFNASEIPEVMKNGFTKQKQRVYSRQRTRPQQIDTYNYSPFLTLNFSMIAVPKDTSKDLLQEIIIKSNTADPFKDKQFMCFNYLLIINKIVNLANGYSNFSTYTPNIKNMKDASLKLIKQQFHQNPYNTQAKISSINLTTIKIKNPTFSAYFIANHPYIKFIGQQIYQDQQSLIVSLKLLKNNSTIYFGKGFTSISSMMTVMKNRSNKNKKIQYCVRMFSKRMRGRIASINLRDQYCFGDFEVIFEWRDFLTGKIDHNLNEFELFGDQNFYCIIEVQKENILGFQVKSDNFL